MVAAMLGKPLMEWQQHVADVVMEIDPVTGRLAYDEWILTVPRQSGKSIFILAKASHRGMAGKFFGGPQEIAYAAQTYKKSTEKFEKDYSAAVRVAKRSSAALAGMPLPRTGNQKVDIRYPNGSSFFVESATEKSGHGSVLDEAYVDEAFAQQDNRLEDAFKPAMITRRNKQLGVVSTAGWSDASPYLLRKVEMGRALVAADVRLGTAFFEWSAPDDADPGDELAWLACMPAVHRPECVLDCDRHTIDIAAIRSEYQSAVRENKLANFCRAYMNQWKPKPREGEETALGNWLACSADVLADEVPAPLCLGAAVALGRDFASIGAATTLGDGTPFLAPVVRREGVDWLPVEAARLSRERGIPVVVDIRGTGGAALADAIESEGGVVLRMKLEDYVTACADVYDKVSARTLRQSGDPDLNTQVTATRWRTVGDGRRVFGRRASESDIDLVESVTLALWGATSGAGAVPNIW
jgi:hypothetical protein